MLQVNQEALEFICVAEGGSQNWYYDTENEQYLCLNNTSMTYTFRLPANTVPTLEEYQTQRMRLLAQDGLISFLPSEKIQELTMPRADAVRRIFEHKASLQG